MWTVCWRWLTGDSNRPSRTREDPGKQFEPTGAFGLAIRGELAMPNLKAVFSNLRAPMPLGRKVQRLLVNNWTKIRTRSRCCGHRGEPGC